MQPTRRYSNSLEKRTNVYAFHNKKKKKTGGVWGKLKTFTTFYDLILYVTV